MCLGTTNLANCSSHIDADGQPALAADADNFADGVSINPNESIIKSVPISIFQTNIFVNGTEGTINN